MQSVRLFLFFSMANEQQTILHITPIGFIETPYQEKYNAPRQPNLQKEKIIGTITLLPNKNFEQALEDLAGFERLWILYWFHKNSGWKPKVLPPRAGRTKKGVFATRSPHRPNPIGLSLCKLIEVKGRTLVVENPDLLNGTPIVDIKPYIPYAEAFPHSTIGWLHTVQEKIVHYNVKFSRKAKQQGEWLKENFDINLLDRIVDVLSFDPMPHSYRRIMKEKKGYVIAVKSWRAYFSIKNNTVTVSSVASGYSYEKITAAEIGKEILHNGKAHSAFFYKWMKKEK